MDQRSIPPNSPLTPASKSRKVGAKIVVPRTISSVVFGDKLFKTWYPSLYPEELVGKDVERLHVCLLCFRYSTLPSHMYDHMQECVRVTQVPLGQEIYSHDEYSIHEIDGEEEKNLSLFAKLFLDTKSVFFDVSSFQYYTLIHHPGGPGSGRTHEVVGFFSKEKMSWDNNNLACILIFPPWQRKGLGKILMGASYEISHQEGRIGGPERPLSDLGRKGYLRFWQARVAKIILDSRVKSTMTVEQIAEKSWMLVDDVMFALKEMGCLEIKKRGKADMLITKDAVRAWVKANNVDIKPPVDEKGFLRYLQTD
ncbi:hypothetical protein MMC25_005553 [Agyrium rufum]|nr:hypothetical protein [Agyrium rufum]